MHKMINEEIKVFETSKRYLVKWNPLPNFVLGKYIKKTDNTMFEDNFDEAKKYLHASSASSYAFFRSMYDKYGNKAKSKYNGDKKKYYSGLSQKELEKFKEYKMEANNQLNEVKQ